MSSLNTSAILSAISVMEKELAALRAQISPATEKKEAAKKEKKEAKKEEAAKKEEKEEKKTRAPTAWLLFTERVRNLLRENGYEKKHLGPEMTKFCSELKKDNEDLSSWSSEDILARRAAWTAPEAKAPSAPASVVEEKEEKEEKKPRKSAWEGLSEEDRAAKIAKMQAGRAAKKAAKGPEAEEAAPASDGEASVTSSEKKKRGPKKLADMSSEERAAHAAKVKERAAKKAEKKAAPSSPELPPLPPSPVASVGESSFKRVLLDGKRYLVNMTSGHTYFREADDSQGDWAGIFKKTGSKKTGGPWVDDSISEPVFTDLEELD
jgi:hypothetical protein